jgi:hypothetical protein
MDDAKKGLILSALLVVISGVMLFSVIGIDHNTHEALMRCNIIARPVTP